MDEKGKEERVNGHRASGLLHLLHPALRNAPKPDPERLPFDLDRRLAAVVPLRAEIPEDAFTAPLLGTEREGSGIVIDDDGLVLTIGYLIAEANAVTVGSAGGPMIAADVVAYDYESGFGLVRAEQPIGAAPLEFGASGATAVKDNVIVATQGGFDQTIAATVVSKREFAGYWEYLLDEAIFTTPPHPNWGGAALIDRAGNLVGVGSLYVEDALPGHESLAGNMFVPIDVLKPIFQQLITMGHAERTSRPWLGLFSTEAEGRMFVAGVAPGGPADRAGLRGGDLLIAVAGEPISGMADMYRKIWRLGEAGVEVRLGLQRGGDRFDVVIRSRSRYDFMKLPQRR